jgi:hypothetical protein
MKKWVKGDLISFSGPSSFPLYIVLFIGTVMVTFTGRCFIALVLKVLPWNKNLAPGASCEIGSG